MKIDSPRTIGPLRLTVDAARARAYAHDIGAKDDRVPLAYPAVWLTEPALSNVVSDVCETLAVVPVHESQAFVYERPLIADESYDVTVTLRREETPPRLIADALIATTSGAPVGKIEAMLRLVPRDAFDKGAKTGADGATAAKGGAA